MMKNRAELEWVGGLISMPAYVASEGEPYRPEVLIWMGADGAVLGSTVGRPGEVLALASASLQDAILRPMWGQPHVPSRVRVDSPELAAALRRTHAEIDIVCGPTPELDPFVAAMQEKLGDFAGTERSYLSPEIGPDAVAAFFRAAAGLFRAEPWAIVPDDQSLISVSVEDLGVRDAAISVIGQLGKTLGLIFFAGIDDFEDYLDAAHAMKHGEQRTLPPHFALNFDRGDALSPALRKEIAKHQWEIAAANAYPWLVAVDEDLVARPPTAEELTFAEAIALALPQLLEAKKSLAAAFRGGAPLTKTVSIRTHAGELAVTLRVPFEEHVPSHRKR